MDNFHVFRACELLRKSGTEQRIPRNYPAGKLASRQNLIVKYDIDAK